DDVRRGVDFVIAAHHLSFIVLLNAQQPYNDFLRILDHVVIRQDGTVTSNNEARAQTALPLRPPWHRSTKKAPPEIVERIILAKRVSELLRTAAFAHLSGRNIDDDGAHFFCQRDKIGQLARRPSVR